MTDLTNKIVLIIGKSLSTSAGIARELRQAGMQIIFGHALADAEGIQQMAEGLSARSVPLTLDNPERLDAEIAALGPVDMVMIVPGWFKAVSFLQSTAADWDTALQDNFELSTYVMRAAGKHLKAAGHGGRILVLSSVAALTPLVNLSTVATSLAALHVIARLAAVELAPYGITVNVVAMGWTPDEWSADYVTSASQAPIEQAIPMQRLGTFADMAGVCRLLVADEAGYITGAVLAVDGGYGLHKASVPPPTSP